MAFSRKTITYFIVFLTGCVFLILFFLTYNDLFLAIAFLVLWLLFSALIIKPLGRFHYKFIFGTSPTDKQLITFIIGSFVFTLILFGFFLLNIKYSTTPFNYFIRTLIFGFLLIGVFIVYKRIRKKENKHYKR